MSFNRLGGAALFLAPLILFSCNSLEGNLGLGTVLLSSMPGHEIEQTYYIGVYDPHDKLPPAFYRVRVHGQASIMSSARFGSGWIRSELIDSLNADIKFNQKGGPMKMQEGELGNVELEPGRRMMMFGPEGVRSVSASHRLVIVMGASPEDFFSGMDKVLGNLSSAKVDLAQGEGRARIERLGQELKAERRRMQDIADDVNVEVGR